MTSPVMQALVNARVVETVRSWERTDAEMWEAVVDRLGVYPEAVDPETVAPFVAWCGQHRVRPCPAQPASVAAFVLENGALGIERMSEILGAVAAAHQAQGLANPVATFVVGSALMQVGSLEAPRSWPKAHKARFVELQPDLQEYIAKHEAQRERTLRQAQNEAAAVRQKLKEKHVETETTS